MKPEILPCKCGDNTAAAKYQSRIYGRGKRLHNACKKQEKTVQSYRCTICSTTRTIGG